MARAAGYVLIAIVFVLALIGVHDWLWGHHERIGVTGMASAAGLFVLIVFRFARQRVLQTTAPDTTPVVALIGLAAGIWAKTMGTLRAPEQGFPIPFGDGACAWSRVTIVVAGAVVSEIRTRDTMELEDGAGNAVEIDVRDADLDVRTRHTFSTTAKRPNEAVVEFLGRRGIDAGEEDVDVIVDWIPLRQIIFATGRVEEPEVSGGYRDSHACPRRLVGENHRRVRVSST